MAEAKRPDGKRRSPTSGPGRSGEAKTGRPRKPAAKSSVRREQLRPTDDNADPTAELTPDDEAPHEPIRQSIIISADRQAEQRMGFTARRAAILAAVVCVLTLTIAGPVRTYFAQRTEMNQLVASEAALRDQISELEQQKVKLADPAYIAAQARERLGFVMPGDIPYQVQLPPSAAGPEVPEALPGSTAPSNAPWYSTLWKTIADDPHPPPVPPSPAPAAPGAPVPPPPPRRCPVVDQADLDALAAQLGREPRGVLEIAYRCPNGDPAVVKTAPKLPDGTPFPTLFYLTHPALTAAASRLESSGLMKDMTDRLEADPELAAAYRRAHVQFLAERDAIEPLGTTFSGGGMPDRVKCLHVVIAHALAKGKGVNPFGDEALAVLAAEPGMAGILDKEYWL